MENNKRGSEIFLGVIGVATLVVAIIGATFAFFSASASSNNEAISVGSTQLSLGFDDQTNTNLKSHLIPAAENIATYAALEQAAVPVSGNAQCIDDNGNEVCGVYEFSVCNGTFTTESNVRTCNAGVSTQDVTVSLNVVTNGFVNLKYKIYEGTAASLTRSSTPKVSGTLFEVPTQQNTRPSTTLALGNLTAQEDNTGTKVRLGTTDATHKEYTWTMVIWLNETNHNQSASANSGDETDEANKTFAAGITITTGTGTGVTGVISAANNA